MNKNRKMEMDAERLNLLQIDFDFDSVLPLSLLLSCPFVVTGINSPNVVQFR